MSEYSKILEEIFNSIHVITDKKIEQLQLDKTIIAPIVKNTNATNNQYTISYQGAEYEVYSIKGDTYSVGENVMVLVPKNNFSNKKLILMRADKAAETAVAAGAISPETQAQIDDAIQKVEDLIIETNNLSVTKSGIFYDPDSAAKEPFATRAGDTWFVSDQGYKIKIARAITNITGITSTGSSNIITILTSDTSQVSLGSYIILRGTSDATNVDGVWAVTGISANTSFTVQTTNNTTQTNLYVSEFSTFVLKWQDAALGAQAIDTGSLNLNGTTIFYSNFADKPLPTTDGDTWFVQDQDKKVKIAKSIKSITNITADDPNALLIKVFTTDTSNLSIGESIYLSGFTLDGFSGERQVNSIGSGYFTFLNQVDPIGTIYNANVQILYWDDMPIGAQAIADNSISAVKIQAGSITADKLVIGNASNLADNGGFELQVYNAGYELDTPGWDFPSPINTVSIYNDPSRSKCLQINGNGTTLKTIASKFIAVQPNHSYFIHGHYKSNSNSASGSVAIGFEVYAKDQSTVVATFSVSSSLTGASTSWSAFKQADANGLSQNISTFNIPSNGYYIKPIITVSSSTLSGSTWYVDDIFLGKSAETSFIADAAITNAKIGSLNAGKITAGTLLIDGTTGANANISIQTSGSERLRLDSTGLYGKNSLGTQTFKLDTLGNFYLGVGASQLKYENGTLTIPAANVSGVLTAASVIADNIQGGTLKIGDGISNALIEMYSGSSIAGTIDSNGIRWFNTVNVNGQEILASRASVETQVGSSVIVLEDRDYFNNTSTSVLQLESSSINLYNNNIGSTVFSADIYLGVSIESNLSVVGLGGNGKIGIGMNSPQYKIHMDNGTRQWAIDYGSANQFGIRDVTASSWRFLIDTSGNTTFSGSLNAPTGNITTVSSTTLYGTLGSSATRSPKVWASALDVSGSSVFTSISTDSLTTTAGGYVSATYFYGQVGTSGTRSPKLWATAADITAIYVGSVSGNLIPTTNNGGSLGSAANKWTAVYATNGTIQTSDMNEKQQISEIEDIVLDAWAKVDYKKFKFNHAVDLKGESARWHIGFIAQEIYDAFQSYGLNAFEYGMLCMDEVLIDENNPDLGTREIWGVRPDECAFLEAALMRRELEKLKNLMG